MSVIVEVVNFDKEFNTLEYPAIIINDIPNATEVERNLLLNTISSTFTDDMISMLPSCDCGELKNVPVGTICNSCFSAVKSKHSEDVKSVLWFRRPDMDKEKPVAKLLNPYIWKLIGNRVTRSGFNFLQWLTDPAYNPKVKLPPAVTYLIEAGVERDYNFFIANFRSIIELLFSRRDIGKKPKGGEDSLLVMLDELGDKIFSDYIPLPNKMFLVTEVSKMGVFIDPVTTRAKDTILSIASIDRDFYDQDARVKRNRTARALHNLSEFYKTYIYENMAQKTGQIRKHWFGTRSTFSFRYVITSIEGVHRYDEIHVPWPVGLTSFRPHLLNKLKKLGWRLNDAVGLLNGHVHRYHPLLDELLKELVTESGKGIPCQIQRN